MNRRQAGQVLPVMLFSFVVTLAVLTAVFNSSMLTFRKTDLVNAADAAAYSGGIDAARSLNFMAYTNRAMVENTIAVGYLVSFISYSRYLGNFLNEVSDPREFLAKVVANMFESSAESWTDNGGGYETDSSSDGSGSSGGGSNGGSSGSQSGNSDQNGNHGVGESFRLIGNKLKAGTKGGMKGIGSAINAAASTLGYATIGPTDLLNTFYSGTQFATYAATGQVIKDTMSEVAKSYDDSITVDHSSHNDYYKWLFPMRPGLDVPPFVNQVGNRLARAGDNLKPYQSIDITVSPADGFSGNGPLKAVMKVASLPVTALNSLFGFNKAHIDADKNDINLGIMRQFTQWSITKHDAWWILWNRGWRFCFPTVVCLAPILPGPPNFAVDKDGHTDLFMAAAHYDPGSGSSGNSGSSSNGGSHSGSDDDSFHTAPGGHGDHSDDDSDGDSFHTAPGGHDGQSDGDSDGDSFHTAPGDQNDRGDVSRINMPAGYRVSAGHSQVITPTDAMPRGAVPTSSLLGRVSLECSRRRSRADANHLKSGGIGHTGVWIVDPHPYRRRCRVNAVGQGRARPVQVAQQFKSFDNQSHLNQFNARVNNNGSGSGSSGSSTAASQGAQSAQELVNLAPSENSTIEEQYQERMKGTCRVNWGSNGYKGRLNGMRSETPAVGASQKGLVQTIKQGIRTVSEKVFDFDEVTRQHDIFGRNSSLEYGTDWVASDTLCNGLFDSPFKVLGAFIKSLFGGDGFEGLKYHLEELATGQASAKEFYAPYQGVPFYFMLAEVPFSNVHPDMRLDVTVKRPASTHNLRSLFGVGEDHGGHEMTAASASKLYYYRQPDDDQNKYFPPVAAGPINPFIEYASSRPVLKHLMNWYGRTAVFTVLWEHPDLMDKLIGAPDDYAEFDNVFNPFWEVRLAKRDD